MKRVEALAVLVFLAASSSPFGAVAAERSEGRDSVVWTKGVGVSYPLVAAVSVGANIPLFYQDDVSRLPLGGFALQSNLEMGIAGGMLSSGVWIPVSANQGATFTAVAVKAAVLRTWLVDLGPGRDRTFSGGVLEYYDAAAGLGAKGGLGYLKDRSSSSRDRGLLYFYVGLGF